MKRKRIIIFSIISLITVFAFFVLVRVFIYYKQIPKLAVKVVDENNIPVMGAYTQVLYNIKSTNLNGIAVLPINRNPIWLKTFIPERNQFSLTKFIDHNDKESLAITVTLNTMSECEKLKTTNQLFSENINSDTDYTQSIIPYFSLFKISQIDSTILNNPQILFSQKMINKEIEDNIKYSLFTDSEKQDLMEEFETNTLQYNDLVKISKLSNKALQDTILITENPIESFQDLFPNNKKNQLKKLLEEYNLVTFEERSLFKNNIRCYIEYPIIYKDDKCLFRINGEFWTKVYILEILGSRKLKVSLIEYVIA